MRPVVLSTPILFRLRWIDDGVPCTDKSSVLSAAGACRLARRGLGDVTC